MRVKIIIEESDEFDRVDMSASVKFEFVSSKKEEILEKMESIVDKIMGENDE